MVNTDRLCFGCMNDNGGEKICPICGFDSASCNPNNALPTGIIISNRYMLGSVAAVDGEGITYIAWDKSNNTSVKIKEYFPEGYALRNPDKTVSVITGGEYIFNQGLIEFKEINITISEKEFPSLIPVYNCFEENGTVYSVFKNISGITLDEFLIKNGGTLKWEQARALFLPLIDTLKNMNDSLIIHRGISPETIIVGRDGKLYISNYSIKALRCETNSFKYNMTDGYSAVELYSDTDFNQGNYTDVYGLSATLFRVLIGSAPTDARLRLKNDSMTIPAHFAEELPRHVLAALANGLQVIPQNRTKNIEDFKNELVYGEIATANIVKKKTDNNTKSKNRNGKKKKSSTAKYVVVSAVLTVVLFAAIGVTLILTVFKENIFGTDEPPVANNSEPIDAPVVDQIGDIDSGAEVTAKLYKVPDFSGKYYAEVIEDKAYEMFELVLVDKEYSDKLPKGTVSSQSVKANSEVERDTKIELTVSLGPKEIKIANLIGLTEQEAKLELLKQGFLYSNIEVLEKYDESLKPETVVDQTPSFGTAVNSEISVKIYINSYKDENSTENNTNN